MIFALIVSILLCCACLAGFITAIKDKEFGSSIFLFFFTLVSGLLIAVIINAMCRHNEQIVEYRFSAEHYTLQEEVNVTRKTVYLNGVEAVEEQRDTTYILTGIEPIIIKDNNFERNVIYDE